MHSDYESLVMAQKTQLVELWPKVLHRLELIETSPPPETVAELDNLLLSKIVHELDPSAAGRHYANARAILQTIETLYSSH